MTVRLIVEAEQPTPAGTPEDIKAIAESGGVDIEGLDMDQLVMGVAVEYEHGSKNGDDVNVTKDEDGPALKIAVAHLREIPDYYTRLADMEEAAKAEVVEPEEDMEDEEEPDEEQMESRKRVRESSGRIVTNRNGTKVDFDAAMGLMDDDLREKLHSEMAPCSPQDFFSAYEKVHEEEFGEEWELSKSNPVY